MFLPRKQKEQRQLPAVLSNTAFRKPFDACQQKLKGKRTRAWHVARGSRKQIFYHVSLSINILPADKHESLTPA